MEKTEAKTVTPIPAGQYDPRAVTLKDKQHSEARVAAPAGSESGQEPAIINNTPTSNAQVSSTPLSSAQVSSEVAGYAAVSNSSSGSEPVSRESPPAKSNLSISFKKAPSRAVTPAGTASAPAGQSAGDKTATPFGAASAPPAPLAGVTSSPAAVEPAPGLGGMAYKKVFLIVVLSLVLLAGLGIAQAILSSSMIIAGAVFIVMIALIVVIRNAFSRWIVAPVSTMVVVHHQAQESAKDLVQKTSEKARHLAELGREMQGMMDDSVQVIGKISVNTLDMRTKATNQAEGVAKTAGAMDKIISNIKNLDSNIEEQAQSASRSSASIEEMISNITSITVNLARNEEALAQLREASAEGNASLQKVAADIQEVSAESERLLEINKVISGIASQTNLLAMNAAIEAAHAGDVGRGFAVVADEIRKLAESSSLQAKTVSSVLKNIKDSLGKISQSTLASLQQFDDIDKGFESVSAQSRELKDSMEQQDAGNREALAAASASNEISRNVHNSSQEIQSASQAVADDSKNLEHLTSEVTNAIGEMTLDIDSINLAVTRTSEISRKNNEDISVLLQEINKFIF